MPDCNDMELVRDYARQNSQSAFAELVHRHVNLVYSTALRHAGMAAQAEEITQAVFIILARKAAGLRDDTVIEAWLYETTRLTALSFLRAERRRQFREQEAYMESMLQQTTNDPVWRQISPLLDEAMMRLGAKEREAVVLHYFKDHFSVLQQMARFPKQVQVENLREEDRKTHFTLKFSQMPGAETSFNADGQTYPLPPLRIDCGNGISQNWRGEFTAGSTTADVVLDAQTMEPVSVVTQTENGAVEEFFSDYTEVTPGSSVPLAVTIKDTGMLANPDDTMVYDWHFKLHDNALWLLDESNYGGKRVLWIDQVAVNGAQK